MIVSRAEVLQLGTLKTTMVWFRFGFNKPLPANSQVCLCLASLPQRGTSHDVLPQHRGGRREGAEGLQGAQTAPPSLRRAKWVLSPSLVHWVDHRRTIETRGADVWKYESTLVERHWTSWNWINFPTNVRPWSTGISNRTLSSKH